MSKTDFETTFKALTGSPPLSWQDRLYREHFEIDGGLPTVVDLPTGMGKTMVMAIWLIARANQMSVPTRLIYVVDRRTVVDQATDLAEMLIRNWKEQSILPGDPPAVSTLRGQLADNREWSKDPSWPAIIIGTVDLIGSALLFSGYRSSYKRRPLEAGLLGQDSLLVLDEAHLSAPFEKLILDISSDGRFQRDRKNKLQGKPMRVIRMSATTGRSADPKSFALQLDPDGNLTGDDANDITVVQRFRAKKHLTILTIGEKEELNKKLASTAVDLANRTDLVGKRIVVFVRRPEDATKIADAIRTLKSTKGQPGPYADSVKILTGTMRGLERDELLETPVLKRFLDGDEDSRVDKSQKPVFLVSTSAGEVGFDLNADHLVGDAAPFDSWVQRLGRVNRRGHGDATVILAKEMKPPDKTDDEACIATSSLFVDGMDVSPSALAALKRSLTPKQIEAACSPKPKTIDLTDILLDAWSMTSITDPMPGRPQVGPLLRGIADDLPQTTIAWRAELDLPGFAELDAATIDEWFDTHRILTHETLSVPTGVAAKWFVDRWGVLEDDVKSDLQNKPVIIDRAGLTQVTVHELIDQLSRRSGDFTAAIRNAELILPASFGGIERHVGLLDKSAPKEPENAKDADDATRSSNTAQRDRAPDVADERGRFRELVLKPEDGEEIATPVGSGTKPTNSRSYVRYSIELESDDDRTLRLVSYIPRREKPEYGSCQQPLRHHVDAVREAIDGLLGRLALPEALRATVTAAAQLAADYHDHGKNRERWQRLAGGKATPAGQVWLDATLGKTGGEMKRDSRGYRHEFGSLREFADAFKEGKLVDQEGQPISGDLSNLAAHLIATHHGRGRPHFSKGGFDPNCEPQSEEIHTDVIQRFARLQRKYGWWHLAWLENLLRCADQLASADNQVTEMHELEGGNQ